MQKYKRYICSPCWSARQRKYEMERRERVPDLLQKRKRAVKERKEGWSEERKEQDRRRTYSNQLRKNYGITIEDFDDMYDAQGGKCRICETTKPKGRGGFHVDHCHATGAIRGLLCTSCNMMLGLVEDSVDRLNSAIAYLQAANDNKTRTIEEAA
ncbi:endonuclease VII domain-containing protein [Rhizobium esperanzae]|uniref:Recombination endonuclease VII n=1 Tax=Rhizobium esperanzae TaxID=1967781 RepID=A0A7W6W473_9HYPH|nr:endonuclease VII domain-containing protein [Rhizobium esperanzae]MBB4235016.1 hypothetical protein [Rhizobium esperanzae]